MKGLVKGIVSAVLALAALVVLAVVLLVTLLDPNDYRDDISRIAREQAGVELELGGDLSWRFYPVLGFGAADVGLAMGPDQPQLVRIGELAVGVKLLPLLSSRIEVDALDIAGLQANLVVDEAGNTNWQMPEPAPGAATSPASGAPSTPASGTSGETAGSALELSIPLVRIQSSTIHYEDKAAKAAYTVDLPLLELQDVNFEKPFPLQLEARVRDQAGLDVKAKLKGQAAAYLARQQFGIDELALAAEVGGIFDKPVAVNVQGKALFDQAQDSAEVALSQLQFANLVARLNLAAKQVSSAPAINGHLETDMFDARKLMQALALEAPETLDPEALSRVSLNADLAGTPEQVTLNPLTVKLDDSTLSGEVAVTDLSTQAIRFALQLDRIDADRYLPPPAPETASQPTPAVASAPAAGGAGAELIPVETLRGLNIKGTFKAGEVVLQKIPVRNIGLSVSAVNGDVQLNNLTAQALEGTLTGTIQVDARPAQPKITTRLSFEDIAMSALLEPFVSTPLLSGRANLAVDTTTQGNDMDTLLKQALGQLNVNTERMVVHGVNVNQVALDAIKGRLGDFTALMPNYQDKLPKALRDNTEIRNLVANMTVRNGHLLMPDLSADTGEGQFSASGDINLLEQSFDYHFGVVLSSLDDNKYLKGVKWPVRCRGSLEAPVADWCRPDSQAIGQVLEKAATTALRDKGAEKIGEKLGIEGADEAAVKEQLRQKAKEEEDRAKKKLEESLKKKLLGK